MANTVSVVEILDGTSTPRNFRSSQNSAGTSDGTMTIFHSIEQGGAPLGPGNGLPVAQGGTVGSDSSANAAALAGGHVGATIGSSIFGGSGTFSAYVLVGSVPANPARAGLYVENVSGQQVVCVRDDGTVGVGNAPANASWWILGGGSGAPSQGGSWASLTFKGRLQIWAPTDPGATARPTIMQD